MTARVAPPQRNGRFISSGALAGALSALVFTAIHQFLINPIWFALLPMLAAGAICGTCLAWSYTLVVPTATVEGWLQYNAFYLVMFVALGLVSVLAFDPVTTIAALLRTNEPPRELIGRALPVTGLFALATAALLSLRYRPGLGGVGGLVVTTAVLVLALGLNISILGLVAVPHAALSVLGEVLALLVSLTVVYAAVVIALNRLRFRSPDRA